MFVMPNVEPRPWKGVRPAHVKLWIDFVPIKVSGRVYLLYKREEVHAEGEIEFCFVYEAKKSSWARCPVFFRPNTAVRQIVHLFYHMEDTNVLKTEVCFTIIAVVTTAWCLNSRPSADLGVGREEAIATMADGGPASTDTASGCDTV